MRTQQVMFLGFIFMAGLLISLTFAGGWLSSTDLGVMNSMSGFVSAKILGIWSIPVPNVNFVTVGIAALLKMDFAFFGGPMAILQWFFIATIGAGTVWGLFSTVIYVISGLWK